MSLRHDDIPSHVQPQAANEFVFSLRVLFHILGFRTITKSCDRGARPSAHIPGHRDFPNHRMTCCLPTYSLLQKYDVGTTRYFDASASGLGTPPSLASRTSWLPGGNRSDHCRTVPPLDFGFLLAIHRVSQASTVRVLGIRVGGVLHQCMAPTSSHSRHPCILQLRP